MAKQNNIVVDDVIKWGAIIGGGLLAVKMVIGSIGDSASTATVDGLATLPNDQNPFSPNYTISVEQVSKEGLSPAQYYQSLHDSYEFAMQNGTGNSQDLLGGGFDVAVYAEIINASIGEFFILNDIDGIKAVFNEIPDQETVGEIAGYFSYVLNKDLIGTMRDGFLSFSWLKGGIGDNNLADIVNHVMTLPESTHP